MKLFEDENEHFARNRDTWIKQGREGQWVVVRDADTLGFYPSFEDAYCEGARRFGSLPFLVKEVKEEDDVEVIQRVPWGNVRT